MGRKAAVVSRALSPRELEYVSLVSEGMTHEQVAELLGLSLSTVKTYALRTFEKTGVSNRAQLIVLAYMNGWIK